MNRRTPLYLQHEKAGARFVDFAGWDMPVHYGSQIKEHQMVRQQAGVFDVSHMTVLNIEGSDSQRFLGRVLANDVGRIRKMGKAIYSAMLNEQGHVLDDLIVYQVPSGYLMVVNCATRDKDLEWLTYQASAMLCTVTERPDLAILAVQGPDAIRQVGELVDARQKELINGLEMFQGGWCSNWFIARTGYTGEQGLEIILPGEDTVGFWEQLMSAGVSPVGLGARDTLRLEAGMNLYGQDMDETVSPLESNMANTVVLEGRDFIGADALRSQLVTGGERKLVGLVLQGRGVLRAHYRVFCDKHPVGEITSGAFSPTLGHSIALARVSKWSGECTVEIRGIHHTVEVVKPPFVRNGKQVYKPL